MKKLMILGAFVFSMGAFAQEAPLSNGLGGISPIDPPQFNCWLALVYPCDIFGNPINMNHPWFKGDSEVVTVYDLSRVAEKQRIYCETGIIDNDC